MRVKLYLQLLLASVVISQQAKSQLEANRSLSNLTNQTSINANLLAEKNNTFNLGSPKARWRNVFLINIGFADGSAQTTAFIPYKAGAGISINDRQIINTAPDKIVKLSAGKGISVTGSYPNFTIAATGGNDLWNTSGSSVYCNSNIGIGTDMPSSKLDVVGGDAKVNGITVGIGGGEGASNLALGTEALLNNVSGFSNMAVGHHALYSNNNGYDNSAFGDNALYSNVDGIQNTALGNGTLYYNISGYGNTAIGTGALLNNGVAPTQPGTTEATYNAANGFFSLFNNTTGSNNAGFGTGTLFTNISGIGNTGLGTYADVLEDGLNNAAAIGYNSIVNISNKIRLGNTDVTIVESSAGSWTTSDARFKTNVKENVVGLKFINLLRPIVYTFEADKFDNFLSKRLPDSVKLKRSALKRPASKTTGISQSGFIGQEVADAAKKSGYNFNGVHVPVNDNDNFSISYEKIVVPLVKAVQELSAENDEMRKEIKELRKLIVANKEAKQSANLTGASIRQNVPNPVAGNTVISYTLPSDAVTAEIIISDKNGNSLKKVRLTGKEKGTVDINTAGIAAGTYQYTLIVDGMVVDTKQMIVSK